MARGWSSVYPSMNGAMTDPDGVRHEEAGRWFAAQRRGMMTLDERNALAVWRSDPRNAETLDRLTAAWDDIEGVSVPTEAAEPRTSRRGLLAAAVGMAAAAAALVVAYPAGYRVLLPERDGTIRTAVGEQRTVTFAEGSVAYVNVDSELSYRFGGARRALALTRGDALFKVAKDPERPFIVMAGGHEIRALGTIFSVSIKGGGGAQVAVSEGAVTVSGGAAAADARPVERLAAGWALDVGAADIGPAAVPRAVVAQSVGEWRRRVITYENASLGEVVADLNRYFPEGLRADPSVAARRLTLRLPVERRDQAVTTLAKLLSLKVVAGADGVAVLTAGPTVG